MRLLSAALLAVVVTGGPPAAAEAPDEPPVLLRKSLFLTPIETAGTGLEPEVRLRLTVDTRGRVRDAEVLSISPSSEYDELFREATLETVEDWRYAPARSGGEPVEATLEWTIKFLPKSGRTPRAGFGSDPGDAEARLARIFTFPREKQAERLRSFSSLAEVQLQGDGRQHAETPRFVVISDSPRPDTAATVAGNLEAVFNVLGTTFGEEIEPQPGHYKQIVYVYAHRASFAALSAALTTPEWANGVYVPPGLFAFHLETGTVDSLLGLMIHEAVHAFADQHLVRPGFRLPPWMSEGLAEYVGRSEIRKGRIELGRIREGKYVADPIFGGAYRRTTAAGWSLDRAKQALRKGEAPSVEELVDAAPEVFYGGDVAMHYALSWLLVHYLRHGEPGWAGEEFPTALLYLAEGYPPDAVLQEVYGRTPAEMDAAFQGYVRSL